MAPPPEYDKEPKAPDKCATNISTEDSKLLNNLVIDQHTNSDHRPTNTATVGEAEKKHVETLDDGQLKALLDEAINYKNPKDREGKSKIFKELLEKAEQESDEQACEAAARAVSGCRSARRAGAGRRGGGALPHSNSLQDLVAALAAEPPRKHHARHQPTPSVSARAHHGGSLPSGVDTSSLSEEPARGAGYLATVRCVNPPPLAERRVSASDANAPAEMELLHRRSKPMFPMTYTARATLEIGSGAVCSGRAVTTTTSSNQVRTPTSTSAIVTHQVSTDPQRKLMSALCPTNDNDHGGSQLIVELRQDTVEHPLEDKDSVHVGDLKGKTNIPRGPKEPDTKTKRKDLYTTENTCTKEKSYLEKCPQSWVENVDNWYRSLSNYTEPLKLVYTDKVSNHNGNKIILSMKTEDLNRSVSNYTKVKPNNIFKEKVTTREDKELTTNEQNFASYSPKHNKTKVEKESLKSRDVNNDRQRHDHLDRNVSTRQKKTHGLVVPSLSHINPKNVKPMTVGQPQINFHKSIEEENQNKTPEEIIAVDSVPVDINSNTVDVELKDIAIDTSISNTDKEKCIANCCFTARKQKQLKEVIDIFNRVSSYTSTCIELKNIKGIRTQNYKRDSFAKYVALQQKLLEEIENIQDELKDNKHEGENVCRVTESNELENKLTSSNKNTESGPASHTENNEETTRESLSTIPEESPESVIQPYSIENHNVVTSDGINSAKLSNNAYVLITSPSSNNNTDSIVSETTKTIIGKKKENLSLVPSHTNKKEDILNKNILKILLFENLKNNINEQSGTSGVSSITNDEVDSAISFSCITTPEVVASCNTTSSTSQSTVAVDPKPRSVISSSSYNGLPLSRPNYGSTSTSASDDYKKSLDENGNSVQGFSSPLSGSSQHKKPRRKKSSKNETVIDCQQIDGYQGDKDVNELLRFIESNADNGRAAKLPRIKHKDDSDDKGAKKRSAERRKDKENKIKRATSLEELSRTKIEDLTDVPEAPLRSEKKERRDHANVKQERRSWGDDTREVYDPHTTELTEFQTVTKKRKPRRRADDHERDPPRRTRPPSPRARRESAPPSDRSNDSNDDMDSVHSSPDAPRPTAVTATPHPAAPHTHASYAEIARTRHNIPDLIESCNFYAEGEGGNPIVGDTTSTPADVDGYPALEARTATTRRRDTKVAVAASVRRDRKERAATAREAGAAEECPAPDVVGERRPAVILADGAARARDMDGVTFGFDINEQLLEGGARRPRCDLVRDALAAVCVRVGPQQLRYVPPPHDADAHHPAHLLQIVDYVGAAWEDVVRCGAGKVRYYSE